MENCHWTYHAHEVDATNRTFIHAPKLYNVPNVATVSLHFSCERCFILFSLPAVRILSTTFRSIVCVRAPMRLDGEKIDSERERNGQGRR